MEQRVWYLKTESGDNVYGSVETSANPWTTNPWKKIKGAVETSLTVKPIDGDMCYSIGGREGFQADVLGVVRGLWLVMFSLPATPAGEGAELEQFSFMVAKTLPCARMLLDMSIGV